MKASFAALLCITLFAVACIKDPFGSPYPKRPKIVKVKGNVGYLNPTDSIMISYNNLGNPVSLYRTHTGTSAPSFYVVYDSKGRMTDYYGMYNNQDSVNGIWFDTWQQFDYDYNGHIVRDTTWEFGIVGPGPKPLPGTSHLWSRRISYFEYDHLNRIVYAEDKSGNIGDDTVVNRSYFY